MVNPEGRLPAYLNEKRNIVRLIVFTSVFALVFLNIYSPFGADRWFGLTPFEFFAISSLSILTGVLVVVLSRIIMYRYARRHDILIWQYLLWIFAEILTMALFYAIFQKYVLRDERMLTDLVKISSRHTALILLLPYTISWLYLSWQDKKEQLNRISDGHEVSGQRDMVPFYDEKGILRFSVKKENLLYIESEENYVNICYLNKDKISKYLLRDTLKKMEGHFAGTEIIRCHRSYMVNFEKVKVIRKDKDGLMLELDSPGVSDIPVSKTYVAAVMHTFSKYCQGGEVN